MNRIVFLSCAVDMAVKNTTTEGRERAYHTSLQESIHAEEPLRLPSVVIARRGGRGNKKNGVGNKTKTGEGIQCYAAALAPNSAVTLRLNSTAASSSEEEI